MPNQNLREKIAHIIYNDNDPVKCADKILALLPQEPKEWPKKREIVRHRDHDSLIREYEGYNHALDDAWKVHQRVVGEKDREIAELRSKLNEKG